jgi:hypothetical protein
MRRPKVRGLGKRNIMMVAVDRITMAKRIQRRGKANKGAGGPLLIEISISPNPRISIIIITPSKTMNRGIKLFRCFKKRPLSQKFSKSSFIISHKIVRVTRMSSYYINVVAGEIINIP